MSKEGSGVRLILARLGEQKLEYTFRFRFPTLNNKVEYEELIQGIMLTSEMGAKRLAAYSDSQLVVEQVNGNYKAKEPSMVKYLGKIK